MQQNQQKPKEESVGQVELKEVIKRLDNELKREKSQVEFLRQQLGEPNLFDGLDGLIGDDILFDKNSELLAPNSAKMPRNHSHNRLKSKNLKKSSDISLTPSSANHQPKRS